MSILYGIVGAVLGGLLFKMDGLLFGGGVGLLGGLIAVLNERQKKLEKELEWLRKRLSKHLQGEEAGQESVDQVPVEMGEQEPSGRSDRESFREFTFDCECPVAEPLPVAAFKTKADEHAGTADRVADVKRAAAEEPLLPYVEQVKELFTGGNLLVKLGVVILFIGVSFLVKLAAQNGLFPLEMRLAAVAAGGCAMLITGWRLRFRRSEYALALQGGGVGILYLTTYAAFRLFAMLPPLPAFTLLVIISVLCGFLALLQNSGTLALFGVSGGFIAPLLASTGSGDPRLLFGYYAVLNTLIIAMAWFRSWRYLNLAGFGYTFIIGAIWGAQYYRPQHFAAVEPFLVLFFLMYIGVAVLFAFRQAPDLRGYVDATLVFGTPVVCFALQAGLVHDWRYGLAWSALAAGLVYLVSGCFLRRQDVCMVTLSDAFLGFGLLFMTLSIPLAFDGRWTSAVWAAEGAAMVWCGFVQRRVALRLFGIVLQFGASFAFMGEIEFNTAVTPVLNSVCIGMLLLSLAAFASSRIFNRFVAEQVEWEVWLGRGLAVCGLVWWYFAGLNEIVANISQEYLPRATLLFFTSSALLFHLIERRLVWRELSWPALLLVPAMACHVVWAPAGHPLADGGWIVWPVAFLSAWWLFDSRASEEVFTRWQNLLHPMLVWMLSLLSAWELLWRVDGWLGGNSDWLAIAGGVVPAAMLVVLVLIKEAGRLPEMLEKAYMGIAALPLACWSVIWMVLLMFFCKGEFGRFPWLPLLNPLDLAVMLNLFVLWIWLERLDLPGWPIPDRSKLMCGVAVLLYLWVNSMLVRGLYHWADVPFNVQAILHSLLAQTIFTIFWGVSALCLMLAGNKKEWQVLWTSGALQLGVVVLKLFLVDLANRGTVERIVSFVAVGGLLLVIGWFAPVPPGNAGRNEV